MSTSSLSPLLSDPGKRRRIRLPSQRSVLVLTISSVALITVLFALRQSLPERASNLIQEKAPLFYMPRGVEYKSNTKLPLHINIPQNGNMVDYTLIESPIVSKDMLDEVVNSTGDNGTNASAPIGPAPVPLKCNLDGVTLDGNEKVQIDIRAEAVKVFAMWDKCQRAADYVVPNKGTFSKNASRKLLTQSIVRLTTWDYPSSPNATEVCGGPSFPCPTLPECEDMAAKVLCKHLSKCTNPVCGSFYADPMVERICGVCTMASGAVTSSCWSSFYSLWHCMFS
jgi:hypothetical protein